MIRGAVFDMDGTILESMGVWATAGQAYLRQRGVTPCHGDADSLMYQGWKGVIEHYRTAYAIEDDEQTVKRDLMQTVKAHYDRYAVPKEGAVAFLEALRAKGVGLYLATATDRCIVEPTLSRLGMLSLFEGIVTCTEVGDSKFKPTVFDVARERLGTPLDETWVFEDATYAAVTAKRAGYHVCAMYDRFERDTEKLKAHADVYLLGYHEAHKLPFWQG